MDGIPVSLSIQAEAHAFRSLVAHLQAHPELQNMEMMSAGGFCRNCLSKWLMSGFREVAPLPLERPLTYDDVSEHVYGMPAKAWKDKYQLPASPEAMAKYNGSKAHHAKHLKDVQTDVDASSKLMCAPPDGQATSEVQLDPCCPDPTEPVAIVESPIRGLPELPAVTLGVRLLTVSDRAFNGVYSDESGPMIRKCLGEYTARFPQVRFRLASSEVGAL